MTLPSLLNRMIRRPLYLAAAVSLLLHLLVLLLAADKEGERVPEKSKQDKRQLAKINLQVVPLAPAAAAPVSVRVFREDLFKDTSDEEKNLFKLRKREDARRRIKIDQDQNMRVFLKNPSNGKNSSVGTNGVYSFYILDNDPKPLTPHIKEIPFPDQARALGIKEFSLVFEAVVDTKGRLVSFRLVTNGDYGFGDALRKALAHTRYTPGKIKGKPVRYLLRERALFTDGD